MTAHTVSVFKFRVSSAPDVRVSTTPPVILPPGIQSPPASVVDSSFCGFRSVDCPLRLRVDDALAFRREDDKDWVDGWRAQLSCSASRRATLVTHLYTDQELAPEFLQQSLRRSLGPALGSAQHNQAQIEKLQILSWNLVLHVAQINAPWRTTSTELGTSSFLKK